MKKLIFCSTVLLLSSFLWAAPITNGLISEWQAEGNASDSAGGNNGTLLGGVSFGPGIVDQAFFFGNNTSIADAVNGGSGSLPLGNSARTYAAWVNTTGTGATQAVFAHGVLSATPGANDHLLIFSNGIVGMGNGQGHGVIAGTTRVDDGEWHLIVGTVESNGATAVYVDGALEGTGTITNPNTSNGSFMIGSSLNRDPGNDFFGGIDQMMVYNRALSAGEVALTFNSVIVPEASSFFLTSLSFAVILLFRKK